MNTQHHHLSENELLSIVTEQPTERSLDEIETHVSHCAHCQTRMLQLAAEDQWRNDVSSSLAELASFDPSSAANLDTQYLSGVDRSPSGDEFDLQTVEQMLGQVLDAPTHPELLGKLGRYDIEGILGCGGMGVVLRGFDRDLHRPVAIKMILPRLSKNGTAKQRFAREARAAAAVLHPNVIGIHGIEDSAGLPWFVMPLIGGPSLQALVDEKGPMPEREIVRIALQIASGLAAAHSQGLVHRDIKPANILVDNQINRITITDFGLARRESEESMTQTGFLAGTLNYMSPEQSRGESVDARSDLFSLGSLLYFLGTGEAPFRSASAFGVLQKIGHTKPTDLRTINPAISSTLSKMIDRLLKKSPTDRFQSASELATFLTDYLAHLQQPTQKTLPKVPEHSANRYLRPLWLTIATLVLIAGLAIGAQVIPSRTTQNREIDTSQKVAVISSMEQIAFEQDLARLTADVQRTAAAIDSAGRLEFDEFEEADVYELERFQSELDALETIIDFQNP